MFVERDDALYAPVSPLGIERPSIGQFEQAIHLAQQMRSDRLLADVGLLWSLDQHRLAVASKLGGWRELRRVAAEVDAPKEFQEWWDTFRTFHDDDMDFEIVPMTGKTDVRVLVYAGPSIVRPSDWQSVLEKVEAGASLVLVTDVPTIPLFGESAELGRINARLKATGRVFRPGGSPVKAVQLAGARWFVRSGAQSVWSTAFESDARTFIFAANVGDSPQTSELELSPALRQSIDDTAIDLRDGSTIPIGADVLFAGGPSLAPAEVRAFSIAKRPQGSR